MTHSSPPDRSARRASANMRRAVRSVVAWWLWNGGLLRTRSTEPHGQVGEPVTDEELGLASRTHVGVEVLLGRGDRLVRLVGEDQLRVGFGEGDGEADHTVAAAEVGDAGPAEAAGQVREEEAGADVEAVGAEDTGLVGDGQPGEAGRGGVGREVVPVRPGVGARRGRGVGCGVDQPGLLHRERGAGGSEDPLEETERGGVDLLDHAGADDHGVLVHGGREPVQLVLQEREALGDAYEEDVDPLGRRVLGGEQPDGVRGGPGAGEVGPRRPSAEVRVGDLDELAGRRRPVAR